MRIEIPITVDVVREGPARQRIMAKQGDCGTRYILVSLTACGKPIDIPENVDLILNCSKPDGTYTETEGQLVDGRIEFELTEQTLAVIGDVRAEVQVVSVEDNEILTSAEFAIRVLPGVISDELIESTSEFKVLVDTLARVESIEAGIQDETNELKNTIAVLKAELNAIEKTSNKVTAIDDNSTDEQYPSAKAVKACIDAAIGSALEEDY